MQTAQDILEATFKKLDRILEEKESLPEKSSVSGERSADKRSGDEQDYEGRDENGSAGGSS